MKREPMLLKSVTDQISRIPVDLIAESIVTLRTEYDKEALGELSDSMTDQGQLQPIVVQKTDTGYYELVIGSRRLRGAKLKRQTDIAAYIIDGRSPVQLIFIALAENLQRVDLNPFEEAQAFLRLAKEFELSPKEIAAGINKPEGYVRSRFQLLSMPEEVVAMVSQKTLPFNAVRTLAQLPSGESQVRFAHMQVKNHLTMGELSGEIHKELERPLRKERASYALTSIKLSARIDMLARFLSKAGRRMKLHLMNATERKNAIQALQALENQAATLRRTIEGHTSMVVPRSQGSEVGDLRNHGEEWTVHELKRIRAVNRPSDEELAKELGRTVSAIQVMRSKASA